MLNIASTINRICENQENFDVCLFHNENLHKLGNHFYDFVQLRNQKKNGSYEWLQIFEQQPDMLRATVTRIVNLMLNFDSIDNCVQV